VSHKVSLNKARSGVFPLTESPHRNGILEKRAWFSGTKTTLRLALAPASRDTVDGGGTQPTKLSLPLVQSL